MYLRRLDREELIFQESMHAVESFTVNTRFQVPSSLLLKTEAGEFSSLLWYQALTLELYLATFRRIHLSSLTGSCSPRKESQ